MLPLVGMVESLLENVDGLSAFPPSTRDSWINHLSKCEELVKLYTEQLKSKKIGMREFIKRANEIKNKPASKTVGGASKPSAPSPAPPVESSAPPSPKSQRSQSSFSQSGFGMNQSSVSRNNGRPELSRANSSISQGGLSMPPPSMGPGYDGDELNGSRQLDEDGEEMSEGTESVRNSGLGMGAGGSQIGPADPLSDQFSANSSQKPPLGGFGNPNTGLNSSKAMGASSENPFSFNFSSNPKNKGDGFGGTKEKKMAGLSDFDNFQADFKQELSNASNESIDSSNLDGEATPGGKPKISKMDSSFSEKTGRKESASEISNQLFDMKGTKTAASLKTEGKPKTDFSTKPQVNKSEQIENPFAQSMFRNEFDGGKTKTEKGKSEFNDSMFKREFGGFDREEEPTKDNERRRISQSRRSEDFEEEKAPNMADNKDPFGRSHVKVVQSQTISASQVNTQPPPEFGEFGGFVRNSTKMEETQKTKNENDGFTSDFFSKPMSQETKEKDTKTKTGKVESGFGDFRDAGSDFGMFSGQPLAQQSKNAGQQSTFSAAGVETNQQNFENSFQKKPETIGEPQKNSNDFQKSQSQAGSQSFKKEAKVVSFASPNNDQMLFSQKQEAPKWNNGSNRPQNEPAKPWEAILPSSQFDQHQVPSSVSVMMKQTSNFEKQEVERLKIERDLIGAELEALKRHYIEANMNQLASRRDFENMELRVKELEREVQVARESEKRYQDSLNEALSEKNKLHQAKEKLEIENVQLSNHNKSLASEVTRLKREIEEVKISQSLQINEGKFTSFQRPATSDHTSDHTRDHTRIIGSIKTDPLGFYPGSSLNSGTARISLDSSMNMGFDRMSGYNGLNGGRIGQYPAVRPAIGAYSLGSGNGAMSHGSSSAFLDSFNRDISNILQNSSSNRTNSRII